jgi:hypothetical protein
MLVNRRTYRVATGTFDEALAIARELVEVTQAGFDKELRVLTAHYGLMGTIILELAHEHAQAEKTFSDGWYPRLREKGLIDRWFALVDGISSELWVTLDHHRD